MLDGCYLLFWEYLQEEKNLFISWNRAGKKAEVLKKVTTDFFAWMIKQMLLIRLSYDVKNYVDLGRCYPPRR